MAGLRVPEGDHLTPVSLPGPALMKVPVAIRIDCPT